MSKIASDDLFRLIKTLEKGEKRYFSISSHASGAQSKGFIRLFKAIDKQKNYEEDSLLSTEHYISHFASKKIQLYDQLLKSLASYHSGSTVYSALMQNLEKAIVLRKKGLPAQCYKLVEKSIKGAEESQHYTLMLQFLFLKIDVLRSSLMANYDIKNLEAIFPKIEYCQKQIRENTIAADTMWSVLFYAQPKYHGPSQTRQVLFKGQLAKAKKALTRDSLSVYARYCYLQTIIAYHSVSEDLSGAYEQINQIIHLLEKNEVFRQENETLILYAMHDYIRCLTDSNNLNELVKKYDELINMRFTSNRIKKHLVHLLTNARLHLVTEIGEFEDGINFIKTIDIPNRKNLPGEILFDYNCGYIYFAVGDFRSARKHLGIVMRQKSPMARLRMQLYAHLLMILVCYEMQDSDLFDSSVRSMTRKIKNTNQASIFIAIFMQFLKVVGKNFENVPKIEFVRLRENLDKYFKENQSELRIVENGFDFLSWIDHKVSGVPFSLVVKNKALRLMKDKI